MLEFFDGHRWIDDVRIPAIGFLNAALHIYAVGDVLIDARRGGKVP